MSPKPWLLTHLSGKTLHSALGWIVFIGALIFIVIIGTAMAHEAVNLEGKPLGFNWPTECCGGQDCAFIPASAVQETPEGYRVTLKVGQHPMLYTRNYSGVIPYGHERVSPTGDYAICLGHEGNARFCFFAGGRGF